MPLQPTPAHYQTLRRLRRMVLRSETAVLVYLWGDDPRSTAWLRKELDQGLRARARRVVQWSLGDEAGFQAALTGVLAPEPGAQTFAAWIDLPASAAAWPLADHWLARLNERRLQLLHWPRAVILCGPTALEARAGEVAPDLWSVRSASWQVPAWLDVVDAPTVRANPPLAWAEQRQPYLALWQAAWVATGGGLDPQREVDVSLGLRAAEGLLRDRQLDRARQVLEQVEQILQARSGDDSSAHQHGQWLYLGLHGDWLKLSGRLPEALRSFEAGLAVAARLLKLTGESPEALRDGSESLDNVGDVQRALGDLAGARERYAQSLALSERLVRLTGESPEALRDLALSRERMGTLSLAQHDSAAARAWFEQARAAAEAALRQSPLSQDIQNVVATAHARLAALPQAPA